MNLLTCHEQSYSYSTGSIHSLILRLFEKYANILEIKFGKRFESVCSDSWPHSIRHTNVCIDRGPR